MAGEINSSQWFAEAYGPVHPFVYLQIEVDWDSLVL
jgi:hypothetical protein